MEGTRRPVLPPMQPSAWKGLLWSCNLQPSRSPWRIWQTRSRCGSGLTPTSHPLSLLFPRTSRQRRSNPRAAVTCVGCSLTGRLPARFDASATSSAASAGLEAKACDRCICGRTRSRCLHRTTTGFNIVVSAVGEIAFAGPPLWAALAAQISLNSIYSI